MISLNLDRQLRKKKERKCCLAVYEQRGSINLGLALKKSVNIANTGLQLSWCQFDWEKELIIRTTELVLT